MSKTARNIVKAPFVLLVRIPIMLALWGLVLLGEYADKAYDWVNYKTPSLDP